MNCCFAIRSSVLVKHLPRIKRKGISVIQLTGGFPKAIYESGALDILKSFVDCVDGSGYQIPAPAMVDQPFIAAALRGGLCDSLYVDENTALELVKR